MSNRDNVRRFAKGLKDWGKKTSTDLDHWHREASFEVGRNIVAGGPYSPGTPVREGYARDSWSVGFPEDAPRPFNGPLTQGEQALAGGFASAGAPAATTPPRDTTGEAVLRDALAFLNTIRATPIAWKTACPYMPALEDGWSQQAPEGMIRNTVAQWAAIQREAWRRVKRGSAFTEAPSGSR